MKAVEANHGIVVCSNDVIQVAYSGIEVGNVDTRWGSESEVQANREKVLQVMGTGGYVLQIVELGNRIAHLDNRPEGARENKLRFDGLFTTDPNTITGINPADCPAMIIYDGRYGSVMGTIHVGRQGIDKGIHLKAWQAITDKNRYAVTPEDVKVFFTPSIRPDSYYFENLHDELKVAAWDPFIERRGKHHHIDVVGRVVADLTDERVGLLPDNITIDPLDVGAMGSQYFSHTLNLRGQGPKGRGAVMARLIAR